MKDLNTLSIPEDDLLLSTREAARVLRVSEATIRNAARTGTLRVYRKDRAYYYPLSDVCESGDLNAEQLREDLDPQELARRGPNQLAYDPEQKHQAVNEKTHEFIDDSWKREQQRLMREMDSRIRALERVSGTSARAQGITKSMLDALAEESVRRSIRVDTMDDEELNMWIRRVRAMDHPTVATCLSNPELVSLPMWLLRIGLRAAKRLSSHEERVEAVISCRDLRLLIAGFNPPRPVWYRTYTVPKGMNAIEGLIIASHSANSV